MSFALQRGCWRSTASLRLIFTHTQIRLHHGETQVWNRGGVTRVGVELLTRAAQAIRGNCVEREVNIGRGRAGGEDFLGIPA